jgi:hypothetical protein
MKTLVRIVVFFAACLQVALAQDPWILQNSMLSGDKKFISTILVTDSLTVWGGVLDLNANPPFCEFTRTMDGGMTWQAGTIDSSSNYLLMSMAALNKDTAWAAAVRTPGIKGDIFRTYDGGTNWQRPDTSIYKGATSFPDDIYFFDKDTGICFGDQESGYFEVYRTVNGGDLWTRIPSGSIPPSLQGEGCYHDVKCVVHDTVWIGSSMGRVFRSVDKGLHWAVSNPFESDVLIAAIAFRDSKNGLIIGGINNIKRTKDGGTTWESFSIISGSFSNVSLIYVKGHGGQGGWYICGGYWDTIHFANYSEDDGETWNTMDELYHCSFGFYDITTGWSCILPGSNSNMVPDIYKFTGLIPTGIQNFKDNNDFFIYPNPNNGLFIIKPEKVISEIEILNMLGKRVYLEKFNSPPSVTQIDLKKEPSGMYLILFRNQIQVAGSRIVIKSP